MKVKKNKRLKITELIRGKGKVVIKVNEDDYNKRC